MIVSCGFPLARGVAAISGSLGGPPLGLSCLATVAVPPLVRAEGMTEQIGDIVLICNGGQAPAAGSQIPTVNVTVSLGTNITSRILGNLGASNSSEALLLIDEPGSSLPAPVAGFGSQAPQTLCSSVSGAATGGCTQYVGNVGGVPVAVTSPGGATPGANVFEGLVSTNQVTFQGIPMLQPAAGSPRIFRITNVRVNASGLGSNGSTIQVLATVSSGGPVLTVADPVQIAAFEQAGLSTSLRNPGNTGGLSGAASVFQCGGSSSPGPVALLQFSENFGTAFKTRVAPTATTNGQSNTAIQNVPGTIYNSESDFILAGSNAGLADYGTRLKAVFHNVPAGVRIFVSTTNLANTSAATPTAPAGNATTSYAELVRAKRRRMGMVPRRLRHRRRR